MGTRSGIAPARAVAPLAAAFATASLLAAPAAPARTAHDGAQAVRHGPLAGAGANLHVLPDPVTAGEPVLVVGRLPTAAAQTVTLWQRTSSASAYTAVAQTTADQSGAFEFVQPGASPQIGLSLYAAAANVRTATVHEQVGAAVGLQAGTQLALVGAPVSLSGQVSPAGRPGEVVAIQRASGSGGRKQRWRTIARAPLASDGTFTASVRFGSTQAVTLRALYAGDPRVLSGTSDPVDLIVQRPVSGGAVSLVASADPIDAGQQLALSGTLSGSGGGQPVTLLTGAASGSPRTLGSTMTDAAGDFSFGQTPVANSLYRVQAAGAGAQVLVGVRSLVTLGASNAPAALGERLTLSGVVTPAASGQPVELQQLGQDGAYHTVAMGRLGRSGRGAPVGSSAYRVTTVLSDPGLRTFRALAPGGPANQTGVSAPVNVSVTPAPAAAIELTLARTDGQA